MKELRFLSNLPTPYNRDLLEDLHASDVPVYAAYLGDPASQGRDWAYTLAPYESIPRGMYEDLAALRRARAADATFLVSGGYATIREAARILVATGGSRTAWWGERFQTHSRRHTVLRSAIWARFDVVLAVGTWAVQDYRAVVPPSTPVHVFPYTVAVNKGDRCPAQQPVVGFVGTLDHRKGLDIVLRALAEMPTSRRPLLHVAGVGEQQSALRGLAEGLGVAVEWFGHCERSTLAALRASWWAQVVPSRYDGWALVVSEAMASGVPVIGTPTTGAVRDLIRDRVTGIVVDEERDWAPAMALLCDQELVERLGMQARAFAELMSSEVAAGWLVSRLEQTDDRRSRSLVAEAWATYDGRDADTTVGRA